MEDLVTGSRADPRHRQHGVHRALRRRAPARRQARGRAGRPRTGFFAQCLTGTTLSPSGASTASTSATSERSARCARGHRRGGSPRRRLERPDRQLLREVTLDVNHLASVWLAARRRRRAPAASSSPPAAASTASPRTVCDGGVRNRAADRVRDLEVLAERDLAELADDNFAVTCLRFATACGMTDRLRLDLVLNDFVAGARGSARSRCSATAPVAAADPRARHGARDRLGGAAGRW